VNKARTTGKCNFGTFYVNRRREIGARDSYVRHIEPELFN